MNTLGEKLKKRRTELGISPIKACGLIEISENQLRKIEQGKIKTKPNICTMYKISEVYNIDLKTLLKTGNVVKKDNPIKH